MALSRTRRVKVVRAGPCWVLIPYISYLSISSNILLASKFSVLSLLSGKQQDTVTRSHLTEPLQGDAAPLAV